MFNILGITSENVFQTIHVLTVLGSLLYYFIIFISYWNSLVGLTHYILLLSNSLNAADM